MPEETRRRLAEKIIKKNGCDACKQALKDGKCFLEHGCFCCKNAVRYTERSLLKLLKNSCPEFRKLVLNGCEMKGFKAVVERTRLGLSEADMMKLKNYFDLTVESPGCLSGVKLPEKFILDEKFWRHIFTGEMETLMDSSGNVLKKLSGFHHDLHWRDVGRNLFKLENQVYDKATRVLQADVVGGNALTKTFYPKHWLSETVSEKIMKALRGLKKVRADNNRFIFTGVIDGGIEIEFVASQNGRIITVYPIL